jgi:hypothetical protein
MRLLILTPYRTLEGFREFQASRLLLAALAARRIEVTLHQPWQPLPDLPSCGAVLCWTYRHTWGNHLFWAKRVEERCRELNVPVVNSARRFNYRHSHDLALWSAAGLPCAAHQRFTAIREIRLPFPLILRRDGEHQGRRLVRVEGEAEAEAALERSGRGDGHRPKPFDLALEFVDTRWPDGFYRKRRAYVVGGSVIPAHAVRSEHWVVNFGSRKGNLGSYREDREFLAAGEPEADLLRRAAAVLGADLAALDYSPRPEGGLALWEANRNPRMWGDRGLPAARPRGPDRSCAEAVVELVLRRAAEAAGTGSAAHG